MNTEDIFLSRLDHDDDGTIDLDDWMFPKSKRYEIKTPFRITVVNRHDNPLYWMRGCWLMPGDTIHNDAYVSRYNSGRVDVTLVIDDLYHSSMPCETTRKAYTEAYRKYRIWKREQPDD